MKNRTDTVAVCSRSFSKNPILRSEILEKYANVKFNDQGLSLSGDELVNFIGQCNKAVIALEVLSDNVLGRLPHLQVVSKYGVGLDMIDFQAMYRYKKCLGWTPGVNKRAVAELALCFILTLLRKIQIANDEVSSGIWKQVIGSQLSGKTIGIIGCGNIGKDLISLLGPFKCKIYVHDINDYAQFYSEHKIDVLSLDELMSKVDVISLHVPLDKKTKNIINRRRIGLMKPTAVLINVARGGLVDEIALKEALASQAIAGAAFDVFSQEPPSDMELIRHPNFLATPHIGGSSVEAILAMGRAAIDGLDNFNEVVL